MAFPVKNNKFTWHGIASKLFVKILFFSLIISLTSTLVHYYLESKKEVEHLEGQVKKIEETYLQTLSETIWVSNIPLIEQMIEGMSHSPHLQFITLNIPDHSPIIAGKKSDYYTISKTYPLKHTFRDKDIDLGTLQINFSIDHSQGSFLAKGFSLFATQAITVFIVSIFIFYLFYTLVGRHLSKMAQYTKNIKLDTLEEPLILDEPYSRKEIDDELSTLMKSINSMRENLFHEISERDKTAENLKKNEERMQALLALHSLKNLSEQDLISHALEEAVRLTNSEVGYLHYVNDDEQTISLHSWSKETMKLCKAEKAEHYPVGQAGIWADCIRERKAVIHNDYPGYHEKKGYPEGHFPILRHLSVPIIEKDKIVLVIGVGNKKMPYDNSDTAQLELFFSSTWDIIRNKRSEEEKIKALTLLNQAQKMESIGTLAGGIAHDFNNILAAILGYGEMVLDELPPESNVSKMQQEIVKAGNRAKELVKQILSFSRQRDLEKKPVQIDLMVKEAIKMLRASIPTTIEIKQDIEDCGFVFADPSQLHQIIMNLCANAYQAMSSTGGILKILLHPVQIEADDQKAHSFDLSPGPYVKLEVCDTGHGMDKDTIGKIFEPYFTTKEKGKGTGLGLAVVHGLVKSFGGHVSVYSEKNKGTKFCVYLPATFAKEEKSQIMPTEAYPVGKEKILVVDDEEAIASMVGQMLERLGYQTFSFTSANDAWQAFNDNPQQFELVITDMTMPGMTGVELSQKVRSVRPDIPIILCTGYSELIDKEKSLALGINGYLSKPVLKRVLAETVRLILDQKSFSRLN